jgi:hypothetical protein
VKIAGILSWFDEQPSMLATAVAGMARICDAIVAHDGAYALFPGARPRSHPSQAEAIIRTAEALDVECLVYRPREIYWGNEVEKRNQGLRLAGTLLEPDTDWLLVFDADFHILKCDPGLVRGRLENTDLDVATYTILDGKDLLANEALAGFAKHHGADTEWTMRTRDIYRWTPSLTIGPRHWDYWRTDAGCKRWLRGPEDILEPSLDLNADLVVYHRNEERAQVRRDAAHRYYLSRAASEIEKAPC